MLINLSNHPFVYWSEEQRVEARNRWGRVEDISFPQIDPMADTDTVQTIARDYCSRCVRLLHEAGETPSAVHLMGEMVFCFHLTTLLKAEGVEVVASTARRNVSYSASVKKTIFDFVTFRNY